MLNTYSLILLIISLQFLLDLVVKTLNLRALQTALPSEFQDTYDDQKYQASQKYLKANSKFSFYGESFGFITKIIFLHFILQPLYLWVNEITPSIYWQSLLYLGSISIVSLIIDLPFSYYQTFVIEESFGFNKMTLKTFFMDRIKGLILLALIGSGLLAVLIFFFQSAGSLAWLYCWIFFFAFQLIMQYLVPSFIMPLFNKFEPLAESSLRTKIETYAQTQNFELNGIYTMDGSKRSSKANAFFTGFGKMRRIVLFDTLINNQSEEELLAILAHEMGHCKLKHIQKSLISSFFISGLSFFLMDWVIHSPIIYKDFGIDSPVLYLGFIFFALLFTPLSLILGTIANISSRKHEFEADAYSATSLKQPEALISALKKLSVDNLSNLTPHKLNVFMNYSHPPVLERIEALQKIKL